MADSLLDFGSIAQLAQNNLRNAMQMEQMGMHGRQLDLQERQADLQERKTQVDENQLYINDMTAKTARLNSIKSLLDHPLVQNNDSLQDQLFSSIAPELGIPTEGLENRLTQARKDRMDLLAATVGNDPQKAEAATIKLMSSMDNESAGKFLKNIESIPGLHAKAQIAKQQLEVNEAKYAELRQNQAIINEGRGPLTALSSALRHQTSVLDTPEYKKAQGIYKTLGRASILDPSDKTLTAKEKGPLTSLMGGNADRLAENLEPEIMRWQHQLDTANRALIDMDHGVKQPGHMKEQLTARIATAAPILGALRDVQAFYQDPLNSEKAELAKHAYKTIEARRVELETMDKKLDAQRMGLVNLANEKFDYKQSQDSALAEAQRRFLALPEKQRNGAAAGRISKAIQEELGVDVLPSKIYEDPNKPQSVTKVDVNLAGKLSGKAADRIDKGANVAEAAVAKINTINRMHDAITSGNVNVGPGANVQQYLGQLASKIGASGKTQDERLANTRVVIQGLADLVLQNREKLEGQGQVSNYESQLAERAATPGEINTFSIPEMKALLSVADRAARAEYEQFNQKLGLLENDQDEGLRKEAKFFKPPPLPKSRFEGKQPSASPSGKAAPSSGKASQQDQSGIATIKSDAEFNKLPSGAIFVGPDGKKRRKP